jgi:hypothetical protein
MPAGETISKRIRKQAFELYFDLGWDTARIHKKLMPFFCVRTVERMIREFRLTFSWEASSGRSRGKARKIDRFALAAVAAMLDMDPTLYLGEVKGKLLKEHGVRVSASTICRGIHAPLRDGGLGLTLQVLERRAMQRCAQERMDWIRRINLGDFEHKNVLVIDESNVGQNMSRRRRGYGSRGHKVRSYEMFGRAQNGTLMAACNCNGFIPGACEFIEGGMDTERMVQYVEEGLVQTRILGNYVLGEPNSVVAMDNVNQHHDTR